MGGMEAVLLLIYKILFIIVFGFAYYVLYKKIKYLEEKIIYLYFLLFFYVGGTLTSLIFDHLDFFFPNSDMNHIETGLMHWTLFFFIVFLIPLLCIIFFRIIMYNLRITNTLRSSPVAYRHTSRRSLFFVALLVLIYALLNVDITNIKHTFSSIHSYTEWVIYRNSLNYSGSFYFICKALSFVILFAIPVEFYFRQQQKMSFALFLLCLLAFGLMEHFLFATKGLMFNFAIGYFIILYIHSSLKKILPIAFFLLFIYFNYYIFNMGVNYNVGNVLAPFLSGITRFTITTPYFIDYYMHHNFDMKIYFSSILFAQQVISPNIKVYSLVFPNANIDLTGNGLYGSLTSGIFVYNYSNFSIISLFKSIFEFSFLIALYRFLIVKNIMTSFKLAILVFLAFNIMNFEFTTILVNPVVGYIVFVMFYVFESLASHLLTFGNNSSKAFSST